MPVLYAFRGDVLELRAIGSYALAEVTGTFRLALADPARPTLRALLCDVRESQVVGTRTTPEVRDTAVAFSGLSHEVGQRIALLASSDVGYGVMRMLAAWAEACGSIDIAVFRDADEAFAWASR